MAERRCEAPVTAIGESSGQLALRDPDVRLMLRVRADEPGAFEELVELYWTGRWIFVAEAAAILRVSTERVYQLCKADRLRFIRRAGRVLILKESVAGFERRRPGRPRCSRFSSSCCNHTT